MDVYLVRHGETYSNQNDLVPEVNGELTYRGQQQIDRLAEQLKGIHFDTIYASPLPRTRKTVETVNKYHNLNVNFDHRLEDIHLTSWAGKGMKEYKLARAGCSSGWFNYYREEDESYVAAYKRVKGFFEDVIENPLNFGQAILIATHSDVIKSLIINFLDEQLDFAKKIKVDNAAVVHLSLKYEEPYHKGYRIVFDCPSEKISSGGGSESAESGTGYSYGSSSGSGSEGGSGEDPPATLPFGTF